MGRDWWSSCIHRRYAFSLSFYLSERGSSINAGDGGCTGSTPFPSQIAGAALVPPQKLDLMKAEINRLIVLTQDAVVPVPINVPRRQYIDFHSDLYPEISTRGKRNKLSEHSDPCRD